MLNAYFADQVYAGYVIITPYKDNPADFESNYLEEQGWNDICTKEGHTNILRANDRQWLIVSRGEYAVYSIDCASAEEYTCLLNNIAENGSW